MKRTIANAKNSSKIANACGGRENHLIAAEANEFAFWMTKNEEFLIAAQHHFELAH